jgi:hypothetical protein
MGTNIMKTSHTPMFCGRRTTPGCGLAVLIVTAAVLIFSQTPARACVTVNGTLTLGGTLTTSCVDVNGVLTIQAGGKLILTGTNGQSSTVNGQIVLQGAASELAFTTFSHSISGPGRIVGRNNAARVTVASGITLTSSMTIAGNLSIDGAGSFTNYGVVEANSNGTLKVAVAGTLDDSLGDRWKASAANATLKFDAALGTISTDGMLSGNFVLSGAPTATIQNSEPGLVTEGRLQMSNGIVDVDEDLTLGDDASCYANITGGAVDVAPGKTFTHH